MSSCSCPVCTPEVNYLGVRSQHNVAQTTCTSHMSCLRQVIESAHIIHRMGNPSDAEMQEPVDAMAADQTTDNATVMKSGMGKKLLIASALVVAVAGVVLVVWKPWSRWVSFGEDFATSPAMAGLAAVLAASIGARALKNQLDHAQSEARHARRRDAEASWWKKFEWVTDRILPKDKDKQEKLDSELALSLATSLQKMSTANFQKVAVDGVIQHYLLPKHPSFPQESKDGTKASGPDPASIRAYIEASDQTGSRASSAFLKNFLYVSEVTSALKAQSIALVDRFDPIAGTAVAAVRIDPDAIIEIENRLVLLELKNVQRLDPWVLRKLEGRAVALQEHGVSTVLVTSALQQPSTANVLPVVSWRAEDGPETLESRIRTSLALPAKADTKKQSSPA